MRVQYSTDLPIIFLTAEIYMMGMNHRLPVQVCRANERKIGHFILGKEP
jgi:hypothetical protein